MKQTLDKKFCKFDEVVKLVGEAVKEPDHTGNYHDYMGKALFLFKNSLQEANIFK